MPMTVTFTEERTERECVYGPFLETHIVNEHLWAVDNDDAYVLAEYDTDEECWRVFDSNVIANRYYRVTVKSL